MYLLFEPRMREYNMVLNFIRKRHANPILHKAAMIAQYTKHSPIQFEIVSFRQYKYYKF